MNPVAESILAGPAQTLGTPDAENPFDRPWTTGIFKTPVVGEIYLGSTGLANDQVGDTKHHGGPEKAVFCYSAQHYDYWRTIPGLEEISVGGMGENVSILNADESTVCIGDIYQFGQATVQVSQPRQPCWRPARRFRLKDFALKIQTTGLTGWYFRVLIEGSVKASTELRLVERPYPQWTVSAANRVMHKDTDDLEAAAALANVSALAVNWKRTLENRLAGNLPSLERRVYGPHSETE